MQLATKLTISFGDYPEYNYRIYKLSGLERRCFDGDDDFLYFISTLELNTRDDEFERPLDTINKLYTFAKYNMGSLETSIDRCHSWAVQRTALYLLNQHNIIPDTDPDQLRINIEDYL